MEEQGSYEDQTLYVACSEQQSTYMEDATKKE